MKVNDSQIINRLHLVLVEWYGHHEVLEGVLATFSTLNVRITVITTPSVTKYFRLPATTYGAKLIELPKTDWSVVLKTQASLFATCDLLIITTIESDWPAWCGMPFLHKTIWMLHNGHHALGTKIKQVHLKAFYRWWRYGGRYQRVLAERVAYLTCPDSSMQRHLIKNYSSQQLKWFPSIPLVRPVAPAVSDELKVDRDFLRIVVPGSVSAARDYSVLIQALNRLKCERRKIELVLAGADKDNLSVSLRLRGTPHLKIRTFDTSLSTTDYDTLLREADVWVLPVRARYKGWWQYEEWGRSKVSGVIQDWWRHGKPLIVAEGYELPTMLRNVAIRYMDADSLREALEVVISRPNGAAADWRMEWLKSRHKSFEKAWDQWKRHYL